MWTVEMEHVGISWDGRPEVCHGRFLPLAIQRLTIDVAKAHGCHAAGGDVKASGDNDYVEIIVCAILQLDAGLIEFDDGVVLDVDNVDIVSIELLEVAMLQTRTFDAPRVRWFQRRQKVPFGRIIDASALLFGPEIVHRSVGLGIEEIVLVVAEPVAEAAVLPELLEKRLTFFGCIFERASFGKRVQEAAEATLAEIEEFWVPPFGLVLFLGGEWAAAHRHGQIGGSLVHLEVAGLWSPRLGDLNARSSSADDGTFLSSDVDLLVRPERRVVYDTFEIRDSGPVGDVPGTEDSVLEKMG